MDKSKVLGCELIEIQNYFEKKIMLNSPEELCSLWLYEEIISIQRHPKFSELLIHKFDFELDTLDISNNLSIHNKGQYNLSYYLLLLLSLIAYPDFIPLTKKCFLKDKFFLSGLFPLEDSWSNDLEVRNNLTSISKLHKQIFQQNKPIEAFFHSLNKFCYSHLKQSSLESGNFIKINLSLQLMAFRLIHQIDDGELARAAFLFVSGVNFDDVSIDLLFSEDEDIDLEQIHFNDTPLNTPKRIIELPDGADVNFDDIEDPDNTVLKIGNITKDSAKNTITDKKLDLEIGHVGDGVVIRTRGCVVCDSMYGDQIEGENVSVYTAKNTSIYAGESIEILNELKFLRKIKAYKVKVGDVDKDLRLPIEYAFQRSHNIPIIEGVNIEICARLKGNLRILCSRESFENVQQVEKQIKLLLSKEYQMKQKFQEIFAQKEQHLEKSLRLKYFSNKNRYLLFFELFRALKNQKIDPVLLKSMLSKTGLNSYSIQQRLEFCKQMNLLFDQIQPGKQLDLQREVASLLRLADYSSGQSIEQRVNSLLTVFLSKILNAIRLVERVDFTLFLEYLTFSIEHSQITELKAKLIELKEQKQALENVEVKIDVQLTPDSTIDFVYRKANGEFISQDLLDSDIIHEIKNESGAEWESKVMTLRVTDGQVSII
ncbi:MAG: hypothetical protein KC646_11005 [Candidatus Cloacimonetes bacterium]|nr:hypothetical protein [Candidatus Cloacimonadota bacterium]